MSRIISKIKEIINEKFEDFPDNTEYPNNKIKYFLSELFEINSFEKIKEETIYLIMKKKMIR